MDDKNLQDEKDKEKDKNSEQKNNPEEINKPEDDAKEDKEEKTEKKQEKKESERNQKQEEDEDDFEEEKFIIDEKDGEGKFGFKTILLLIFVVTLIVATTKMYNKSGASIEKEISYTEFISKVENGEINEIEEKSGILKGTFNEEIKSEADLKKEKDIKVRSKNEAESKLIENKQFLEKANQEKKAIDLRVSEVKEKYLKKDLEVKELSQKNININEKLKNKKNEIKKIDDQIKILKVTENENSTSGESIIIKKVDSDSKNKSNREFLENEIRKLQDIIKTNEQSIKDLKKEVINTDLEVKEKEREQLNINNKIVELETENKRWSDVIASEAKIQPKKNKVIESEKVKKGNIQTLVYKAKIITPELMMDSNFMKVTKEKGVDLKSVPPEKVPFILTLLISWFPMFLLIGIGIYMLKQLNKGSGGGPNQIFGMGKSRAKDGENKIKIKFDDVAGVVEAKSELKEVVDFLKEPDKFTKMGAKIPKGVLLLGEPGTGKTLLAKAVAGEAGVPFFSISGSEFVEMFVGVGASRVRDLFNKARKSSPCIVFIDEIDAVGRKRGSGHGGGNDEREQTLNQLLVEMDGFGTDEIIIVIAATNRPDVLDKALMRPGRFDRQVVVDAPDIKGREAILQVHARGKKFADDVDLTVIAKKTPGFVGADLANLLNEAAILAARNNREIINMSDLEEASEKVVMGPERKSRVMPEKEKINTAYHEVGHALIGYLIPNSDPVHKVTIIPRGRALGATMYLPTEDKYSHTKNDLMGRIKTLLGGRAAEDIIFGDVSTGASNDIERATQIAYNMVTIFGMSDEIGPMRLGTVDDGSLVMSKNYGDDIAKKIDAEIHKIINGSYTEVKEMLISHRKELEAITKVLLEKETITGEEMIEIIKEMEMQAEV